MDVVKAVEAQGSQSGKVFFIVACACLICIFQQTRAEIKITDCGVVTPSA
jgi:hypothetical protein